MASILDMEIFTYLVIHSCGLRTVSKLDPLQHNYKTVTNPHLVVFRQQAEMIFIAQGADCGSNVISSHGDLEDLDGDCEPPLTGYGSPPTCSSTTELIPTPIHTSSSRRNSSRLATVSHTSKHHSTTTSVPPQPKTHLSVVSNPCER